MFDIGFAELMVVAVLGLLVLGPERLPLAIRTLALWLGRFKRSFNSIRTEIEREVGADEIRRQLHNEALMSELQSAKEQVKSGVQAAQQPLNLESIEQVAAGATPALNPDTVSHDSSAVDPEALADVDTGATESTPAVSSSTSEQSKNHTSTES